MGKAKIITAALGFALAWSSMSACAPNGSKDETEFLKECALPSDQSGSLYGRWRKVAVPIVFRAGHWSETEKAAIMDAADTWNEFFRSVAGFKVLDYGSRSQPNELAFNRPAGDVCNYSIFDDNAGRYTSGVVIFKQTLWPYSGLSGTIALTTYCRKNVTGSSLPTMFMGIMEANYQDFFAAGKRQPDLKSIFIHELGHLLGLDHSCQPSGTGTSAFAACSQVASKPDYLTAVMFPSVKFYPDGTGVVKESLESNDQGRANCLYGPAAM